MNFPIARAIRFTRLLLAGLVLHGQNASAQEAPTPHTVQAAIVYNLLKFTELSAAGLQDSEAPPPALRLCLSTRSVKQAQALAGLAGRKVAGREIVASEFNPRRSKCDVFYVDSRQNWNAVAEHPAINGALSISPVAGFAGSDQGMIEITLEKHVTGFEINLAQSRRAGIRFSPQLLRLARRVHE